MFLAPVVWGIDSHNTENPRDGFMGVPLARIKGCIREGSFARRRRLARMYNQVSRVIFDLFVPLHQLLPIVRRRLPRALTAFDSW